MGSPSPGSGDTGQWFATTQWSVVWKAKHQANGESEAALEELCRTYWPPIYAYIRREGYAVHDAQDLTQEFLCQFINKQWLSKLEHQNARFRTFLLTFLKHFLSDQRDRASAQKRGGGKEIVSLEAYEAEERQIADTLSGNLTAEEIYDWRWARATLSSAADRLKADYAKSGRSALYDQIKDLQPGKHGEKSYARIAESLGISEQAVKNAVNSFRSRYSESFRKQVKQTISDPVVLEEEIRYLIGLFSRKKDPEE